MARLLLCAIALLVFVCIDADAAPNPAPNPAPVPAPSPQFGYRRGFGRPYGGFGGRRRFPGASISYSRSGSISFGGGGSAASSSAGSIGFGK
uniref:SFRICE_005905 n=1 Tax=Spodoptera frugiperda TaxID=7108 RepID=A0A2H1VD54_SPOFR